MAGNCQRVTIVKLKKLPSAYARSVRRRARLAAREDSGKLSGCFCIRRQNGSEGVAEGGVRFLPMGQPRVTQPWLSCILMSRRAGAIGRGIGCPFWVDARGQKSSRWDDQGGILWFTSEGSRCILRMLPRGDEICRAWEFHRSVFRFPVWGATMEKKKDAPVSFFWGPLWGPWLTEASFVLTMLCSHLFVFLPFYSSYIKTPALPCAERGFMAVIRCLESGLFLAIKYVYTYKFIAKICGFIFTSTGPVGTACCEIVTKLFVKSRMNRQD